MEFNWDLDFKVKLFKEHLEDGGYQRIKFKELLEGLLLVKCDETGKVIDETVNSLVRSAINSYVGTLLDSPSIDKSFLSEYKAFIQKEIFFNQTNIDTVEDFEKIFAELHQKPETLFRGVDEAKYRLYSSLQRLWIERKFYNQEINHLDFIKKMIDNSKKEQGHILQKYFSNVKFDPENDLSILSFLQHYGCPTPLIDWTYSFANALYFGAYKLQKTLPKREIDSYFSVYYIEEKYLRAGDEIIEAAKEGMQRLKPKVEKILRERMQKANVAEAIIDASITDDVVENVTLLTHGRPLMATLTKVDNIISSPLLYFSEIKNDGIISFHLNNNLNIVNQQGVFIWNSSANFPIEHIARNQYDENEQEGYSFSNCLNINKSLRPYILKRLKKLGIDKNFLFPDPEKIAMSTLKNTLRHFK